MSSAAAALAALRQSEPITELTHPVTIGFGGPALPPVTGLTPNEILDAYTHLVDAEVRRFPPNVRAGAPQDADDMRQEGLLALLKAARTYNPDRGTPFTAYARTCIRNAIAMLLRRADPLPETVRRDLRSVRAATDQLTTESVPITITDLARMTGLAPARVRLVLDWQHRHDRPAASTDDPFLDIPASDLHNPEDEVLRAEEAQLLRTAIAEMPELTRRILIARLVTQTPVRTIAAAEGISPARVSQLCTAAVHNLQALRSA